MSSPLVSDRPTSDPSKYIAHVPLVVFPREVGVKASTSSSRAELTPGTTGLPVLEINKRPSGSRDRNRFLIRRILITDIAPIKIKTKCASRDTSKEGGIEAQDILWRGSNSIDGDTGSEGHQR